MLSAKKLVLLAACAALVLVPAAADQSGHLRAHRQLEEQFDMAIDSQEASGSIDDSVDNVTGPDDDEPSDDSENDFGSESDTTDSQIDI